MADKPIPFSAPMVAALIEGRKTQTRRLIKGVPMFTPDHDRQWNTHVLSPSGSMPDEWSWWSGPSHGPSIYHTAKLPYAIGDRLWVREAWRSTCRWDVVSPSRIPSGYLPLQYEADPPLPRTMGRYRHARFMPRWASRLTLTVTDVRVQRLQDISEADAIAEGIDLYAASHFRSSVKAYGASWNHLHGAENDHSWEANPWVVALTFDVEQRNIDA